MNFAAVSCLLAFCFRAVDVHSASVSLSSNQLTLSGNAHIQFYEPRERIWAGLSNGHRYPIINSGDYIALRLAYTSGSASLYWLACITSYCFKYTCPGKIMYSNSWSSCNSKMIFKITAMGKMDGQPINSGDVVSLSSKNYGVRYRLRCHQSDSSKCFVSSQLSSISGNNWFHYVWLTFRIFSSNAVDGTPVQYGDTVGLKYPFGGYSDWLQYYNNYYYSRSCSYYNKWSCAKQNSNTGFQIFKKL